MSQLRPRGVSIREFAEKMKERGFPVCCTAAVSFAERSKESGVQFTQEFRKAAQEALNTPRRQENRVNGNKTTVWLDDELRAWCETQAYLNDTNVGEFIRKMIRRAKERGAHCAPLQKEEAAGAAATAPTVMETGGFGDPSFSDHNTNERRNQA